MFKAQTCLPFVFKTLFFLFLIRCYMLQTSNKGSTFHQEQMHVWFWKTQVQSQGAYQVCKFVMDLCTCILTWTIGNKILFTHHQLMKGQSFCVLISHKILQLTNIKERFGISSRANAWLSMKNSNCAKSRCIQNLHDYK
jgi:hypothetical protein